MCCIYSVNPPLLINGSTGRVTARFFGPRSYFRPKEARCNTPVILALGDSGHQINPRQVMRQVVLVPGLGFGGIELWVLKNRLRNAGFAARIFYYWAWNHSIEECAQKLKNYLNDSSSGDVDFVAHSLGGLIVARFCSSNCKDGPYRVVTLGTPHIGSEAATRFSKVPGGAWVLGRALRTALRQVPIDCRSNAKIGSVAGSLDTGTGWVLGIGKPNDSLVRVDEAHHPDAVDTITVKVSHATMLISKRVAAEVCNFLQRGTFCGSVQVERSGT